MQEFIKKKYLFLIIAFLIITGFIIAFIFNTHFSVLQGNPFNSSKLNLLIVGYDSSINGPPRSDTIILASVDLTAKEAGILFIPRDTRLNIPGHGKNRVNAAHAFGGIELLNKTLEEFLDVPIDYYLETDFDGFARIIDELGGIKINIESPLQYTDKAGGLYINLPAGEQLLSGEEALEYVRYREPTFGDIGRVQRQQKFIKSLLNKALNPDTIIKVPAIYKEIRKSVNTNISFQDISPFVHLLRDMKLDQIETTMVPGKPEYINGASYWLPETEELEILVNNLIRSKEYIKNSQYHISILNGNGKQGIAGTIADEMKKYGFNINKIGNADNFNYDTTLVRYYDPRDKTTALNIRKLIGGKVEHVEDEEGKGLTIIVGSDYVE